MSRLTGAVWRLSVWHIVVACAATLSGVSSGAVAVRSLIAACVVYCVAKIAARVLIGLVADEMVQTRLESATAGRKDTTAT